MYRIGHALAILMAIIATGLAGCLPPVASTYVLPADAGRPDSRTLFDSVRLHMEEKVGKPHWSAEGEIWVCFEYSLPNKISLNAFFHKPTARAFYGVSQTSDTMWYGRYSEDGLRLINESRELLERVYGRISKQTKSFDQVLEVFGMDLYRRCS